MENQYPNQPHEEQAPQNEPGVESYTAPPYDRYHVSPCETAPLSPPPKKKEGKTIPLSSAIIMSGAVSVICSLLVVLVMLYSIRVGDMLSGSQTASVPSTPSSGANTTNIVVDTTAQTSAEAVAKKAGPSVVGIVVNGSVSHYFFGESDTLSEGSGIVYSADGYVLTNYHVIENAVESNANAAVYLPSDPKTPLEATVIGYDISCDLAVLKVNQANLTPIELGDSSQLKVGQTAVAIGNPGGMDFMGSVSMGIISGLDRTLQLEASSTEIKLIQTDAAINPGNSGGALTDIEGKLIGINSAKMASSNFEGMGFAIPVNDAVEIANRIIKNVDAPKPYFGLEISTYYTASTLQMMGYPGGVVVSGVAQDSPAQQAGIQRGDVITHVNNTPVTSYTQFNSEKAKYAPNQTISVTVYRDGKTRTLSITLGTANE